MTKEIKPISTEEDREVDFIFLARKFWNGRKIIIRSLIIFLFFGILVAFLSPKEYTAYSTMVPQVTDPKAKLGALSGLAAMAGVSLSSVGSSELAPTTYPEIISSVPFQLELMATPLNFKKIKEPVTLFEYLTNEKYANPFIKYTLGLPSIIIKAIKGDPLSIHPESPDAPLELNEKQKEVQKILEKKIGVIVDDKNGFVTLACSLPEDYAAAQLGKKMQSLLQKYITEFKIEKAKANCDFISERFREAKSNYQKSQDELALFRDRNKNVSTAVARTEQERLTAEFSLNYGVYSELAKKLEQAKIEVKEETPVFTVIKPVSVPTEKSKPDRPYIIGVFLFIGLVAGLVWVMGKEYGLQVKNKWIRSRTEMSEIKTRH